MAGRMQWQASTGEMVQRAQGSAETQPSMRAFSGAAGANSAISQLTLAVQKSTGVTQQQTQVQQAQVQQAQVQQQTGGPPQGGGGVGGGGGGIGGSPNRGQNTRAGRNHRGPGAAIGFVASSVLSNIGLGGAGDVVSQGLHGFNALTEATGSMAFGAGGAVLAGGAAILGDAIRRDRIEGTIDARRAAAANPMMGNSLQRTHAAIGAEFDSVRNVAGSGFLQAIGGVNVDRLEILAKAQASSDPQLLAEAMLDDQLRRSRRRWTADNRRDRLEYNLRVTTNMVSNLQDAENGRSSVTTRGEPTGSQGN